MLVGLVFLWLLFSTPSATSSDLSGRPPRNSRSSAARQGDGGATDPLSVLITHLVDTTDHRALARRVRELAIERPVGSAAHSRVADLIRAHFASLSGWRLDEDSFEQPTILGQQRFTNLIATFLPKRSQRHLLRSTNMRDIAAPRRLVLAAHYDSKRFEHFSFHAATDSAVPVAILLDLATALQPWLLRARDADRLDLALQLVFFDGEEAFGEWTESDSVYGSTHLASLWANISLAADAAPTPHANGLSNISLFLLLDLIGGPAPTIYNYLFDIPASDAAFRSMASIEATLTRLKLLHQPIDENGLPIEPSPPPPPTDTAAYFVPRALQRRMFIDDDHRAFLARNVPVLHAIPIPYPGVWHLESDNVANLDWQVVHDFALLAKVFTASYLQLQSSPP